MPEPAEPSRAIRVQVALNKREHADLRRRAEQYASSMGLVRVAHAEIFRALLAELLGDEALSARVAASLARTGGNRRHAA